MPSIGGSVQRAAVRSWGCRRQVSTFAFVPLSADLGPGCPLRRRVGLPHWGSALSPPPGAPASLLPPFPSPSFNPHPSGRWGRLVGVLTGGAPPPSSPHESGAAAGGRPRLRAVRVTRAPRVFDGGSGACGPGGCLAVRRVSSGFPAVGGVPLACAAGYPALTLSP